MKTQEKTNTLKQQQLWLMQQIVSGNTSNTPEKLQQIISSSAIFPAQQRLSVYQQGYWLRLAECLAAEFPVLQLYLGEALFNAFAHGYISQLPSQHYSLYELGAHFAQYLQATRPKQNDNNQVEPASYLHLPEQLAQLERAQAESMRGNAQQHKLTGEPLNNTPSSSQSTPSQAFTQPLHALMQWPTLALPATSFLVELDFDLLSYLQAIEAYFATQQTAAKQNQEHTIEKPPKPDITPQALLVFRDGFQVNIVRLNSWQTQIISALQTGEAVNWLQIANNEAITEFELMLKVEQWVLMSDKRGMVCRH